MTFQYPYGVKTAAHTFCEEYLNSDLCSDLASMSIFKVYKKTEITVLMFNTLNMTTFVNG